jgi:hypothetical protein
MIEASASVGSVSFGWIGLNIRLTGVAEAANDKDFWR